MLTKLYKHEFLASSRSMLMLYAAMLVIAGAGRLLNIMGGSNPGAAMEIALNLGEMINVIIIYIAVILTFIVILQRFSKPMLGDEGYIYMTLPAKPRTKVFAKFTCAILWSAATYAAILLTYYIYRGEAAYPFSFIFSSENSFWINFMSAVVLLLIASLVISCIYLSLSLGHLFKKYKTVFSVIIGVLFVLFFWTVSDLLFTAEPLSHILPESLYVFLSDYGLLFSAYLLVYIIPAYEITVHILTKHLNLE